VDRPCILVIDDQSSVLGLLVAALGRANQVWTARDGDEALSLVDAVCLDLILTEVRLPHRSGFEVLRRVQERRLPTQVVMLASRANVPDAVSAMRAGAFDYLAKPVDPEELALVVARALLRVREARGIRHGTPSSSELATPPLDIGFRGAVEKARHRASREYLGALMRRHGGNITQAAQQACMTRESLHRALRRLGLGPGDHGGDRGAGRDDDPPAYASQGA
jgi:DNA-binding NtrC family response regulator